MSTQSACRGELLSRSRPKSLIASAIASVAATRPIAMIARFMRTPLLNRRGRRCCGPGAAAHHRVNAEVSRPVEEDEQEDKAVENRRLTVVDDREESAVRVRHKISDRHFTGGNESRNAREQSES